jgi:hypothetical protein
MPAWKSEKRAKAKPYTKKQAKAQAALAEKHAALDAMSPIPIEIVFAKPGDASAASTPEKGGSKPARGTTADLAAVSTTVVSSYRVIGDGPVILPDGVPRKCSVPAAQIVAAMAGWKWAKAVHGFGTILPPRVLIPFTEIEDLVWDQVVDGYTPGKVEPTNPKSHRSKIFSNVRILGAGSGITSKYRAACTRGDASFKLEIDQAWTCEDHSPPVCFGGDTEIMMADGGHTRARHLAVGDSVKVTGGTATVEVVWRAHVGGQHPMSSIDGVLLTPDHPVCVDGVWSTAGEVAAPSDMHVDSVYNFGLSSPRSVLVRGATAHVECCTLGQPVPGIFEPVWGSAKIFDEMRAMPGFPNLVTCC